MNNTSDLSFRTHARSDISDGLSRESSDSLSDSRTLSCRKADYQPDVDDYSEKLNAALENKEYIHWQSDADAQFNREHIDDYDVKKRAVDKAALETQRDILKENRDYFQPETILRLREDLGSNKIELYNDTYFSENYDPENGRYMVAGNRDLTDGKIRIRDSYNVDYLRQTSTHETMHDLSWQQEDVERYPGRRDGEYAEHIRRQSGLLVSEKMFYVSDGKSATTDSRETGRALNEGYTELFTIEEMQKRGENPHFNSYTEEVGWAKYLRDKVGSDTVVQAYFAGNIDDFQARVDSMSTIPDAWLALNRNMDAYGRTHDARYKQNVEDILISIDEQNAKRLVKKR